MNKKTARRYYTCNEIRDDIDKYKAKARKLLESADALEIKARQIISSSGHNAQWVKERSGFNLSQADRKRRSARRIEEKTLVFLKNKLSEWMTPVMPGMPNENDRSIPVKG